MKSEKYFDGINKRDWVNATPIAQGQNLSGQDQAITSISHDHLRNFHRLFEINDLSSSRFIKKALAIEANPGLEVLNAIARQKYMERLETELQRNFQQLVSSLKKS